VQVEADQMMRELRERTRPNGGFRLGFNEHLLSDKSPEEFYADDLDGVDTQSGIYRLIWYPRGPLGGKLTVISNTIGGLRSAAKERIVSAGV
jgi:hypothetical protein